MFRVITSEFTLQKYPDYRRYFVGTNLLREEFQKSANHFTFFNSAFRTLTTIGFSSSKNYLTVKSITTEFTYEYCFLNSSFVGFISEPTAYVICIPVKLILSEVEFEVVVHRHFTNLIFQKGQWPRYILLFNDDVEKSHTFMEEILSQDKLEQSYGSRSIQVHFILVYCQMYFVLRIKFVHTHKCNFFSPRFSAVSIKTRSSKFYFNGEK
ncbi:unnamed protein product [Heterobilharzia americana]|nr:unnamed protein product [Heterobilharzia americana]